VKDEFDLPRNGWRLWMSREKTTELVPLKTKTLNSYKVRSVCTVQLQKKVTKSVRLLNRKRSYTV